MVSFQKWGKNSLETGWKPRSFTTPRKLKSISHLQVHQIFENIVVVIIVAAVYGAYPHVCEGL
jgi:hypothetical protein